MADDTPALKLKIGDRGEYDVTPPFTNREMHLIKQIAGVRAAEFEEAVEKGDTDILVALAHIAVLRVKQQRPTLDELWDMPAGDITAVLPEADVPDPTPGGTVLNGNSGTIPALSGAPSTGTSSD